MKKIIKLNEFLGTQNNLFRKLDELNNLLKDVLPEHLLCSSHVGAIDIKKSVIVLFVNSSEVLHLVKFHSDNILNHFQQHNYNFDNLLIKVSQRQNSSIHNNNHNDDLIKL